MLENDSERFTALLAGIGETFGENISEARMMIYFKILSKYDYNALETAFLQAAGTAGKFPLPAHIVEILEGDPKSKAENAWSLFLDAVRKGGYMKSVYIEDGALSFAIERTFGGWFAACTSLPPMDDPMFASHKKTFLAMYTVGQREGNTKHYLQGRAEIENASNGGLKLAGRETYPGLVILIQERVRIVEANFSTETGKLCSPELLALPGMQPEDNANALQLPGGLAGLLKGM